MESIDIDLDTEDEGSGTTELKVDVFSSKLFDIRSVPQRVVESRLMEEASGLTPDQFVMGSWALPIIPRPFDREYSTKVRLAPENVNLSFFGHPIYWIDPKITERRMGESDNHWLVRMFYVIFALGLWENPLTNPRWINYPKTVEGVRGYTNDHFHEYQARGAPDCIFDQVKILGESDYLINPDEVERVVSKTIDEMEDRTSESYAEFVQDQITALERASEILGVNHGSSVEGIEQWPNSIWSQVLEPRISELLESYGDRLDQDRTVSDLVRPLYEVVGDCSTLLISIDMIISLLTIPVISEVGKDDSEYARYQTLMAISVHENEKRKEFYDFIPLARTLFDDHGAKHAVKLYQALTRYFDDAHRRLQFSLINFTRRSEGKETYSSLDQYDKDIELRHFVTPPSEDAESSSPSGFESRRERIAREKRERG